jgi:hypothetical protein
MFRSLLSIFLLSASCSTSAIELPQPIPTPTIETVEEVGICELSSNSGAYNHKQIKVTGFAGFAFEDFSLSDPTCESNRSGIWLEYGGKTAAGSMYCCGVTNARTREEPLVVDSIPISLIDDNVFRQFDKVIHQPPDSTVRATLVGRFFAGEKDDKLGTWQGFGHFGCCSLLAVEQVISTDTPDTELDTRSVSDENKYLEKFNSYEFIYDVPKGKEIIKQQKSAEDGSLSWRLTDHRRVVSEYLSSQVKNDPAPAKNLKIVEQSAGRIVYIARSRSKQFVIVVSRPYWLSFYSKDPKKVIWIISSVVQAP